MTDLHLHFDGAISTANARHLAALQGIREYCDAGGVMRPIPADDAGLTRALRLPEGSRDLNDFLKCFALPNALLKTREGIEEGMFTLCEEQRALGLDYAEIRFAPQLSVADKTAPRTLCEPIRSQRAAVEAALAGMRRSALKTQLILCCMRGAGGGLASPPPSAARGCHTASHAGYANYETVEVAAEFLGRGVCAIDLAGAEALFPTRDYAALFRYANGLNIPFTIHAGEAAGPESVSAALDFGARRIGHGVRALEDMSVVRRLAENRIPLELCPTSNVQTGVFRSLAEFPIRQLLDAGVIVTINSDDPSVCNTNVVEEWHRLTAAIPLTESEIKFICEEFNVTSV